MSNEFKVGSRMNRFLAVLITQPSAARSKLLTMFFTHYSLLLTHYSLLLPHPTLAAVLTLTLTPTSRSNALGNPIYSLSAYRNSALAWRVDAVSGTARSQHRDRHKSDNYAPLPDGAYRIGAIEPGFIPEVGGEFIAIEPRFRTRRTRLGIHLDPSYNKRNGRDGTAGCVGITRRLDRDRVIRWVRRYKPKKLRVRIA
jgi:hypothetical protein